VGRTTWCRYPSAALLVPDVGDGLNPNLEAIAARRPDLVVLYRSQLNETAATQLARLGIPAVTLAQDRLEDIAHAARELGRLTGRDAAGDSIGAAIEALLRTPAPAPIRRVAFVVWDNPPMVIGGGSYLDQLATLAGGANVFHDLGAASATVSIETIVARNPDVILVLSESAALPGYSTRREWRAIRAVRERRFIVLPPDLFGRPSPSAPAAVAALRRALELDAQR
jgi:ABC-type Fe3+-hydroxamate transport system substrate-binding protein